MGISARYASTYWAWGALLLGTAAAGCGSRDTSYVDPTALDPDFPGVGGSSGRLNSNGGSGGSAGGPSCVLTGPNTHASLTSADDSDPSTPGLQASFQLQTDPENAGQLAYLILNGDESAMLSATVQESGLATFSNVTLAEGATRTVQGECHDAGGNVARSAIASWGVSLGGCEVAFVTPAPGTDPLHLGPADDRDGTPCGSSFSTSVDVSTNAESLLLIVDDLPVQSLTVSGSSAHFDDVSIGTRNPVASTLKVVATMADGRTCEATRESLVVDCDGPSCTLLGPSENPFLNGSDDGDGNLAGLQADFTVQTELENVNQTARLIIDDDVDGAATALVESASGVGHALFDQITLAEGPVRRVQAECEDALGNVTRSTVATWAVDLTACTIDIGSVASGADPITRSLDQSVSSGIQVPAVGQVSGSDCTGIRAGVCGQPLGSFSGTALEPDGDWSLEVTLADVTASGEVCAEVEDEAGNVAQARAAVNVRSDDPVVEIASPATGATINLLNDLVPGSATCEADFVVRCTDVGSNVELLAEGTTSLGTQPCVAANGLPAPYQGQASFSSVSLATRNGGEPYSITARQAVAGLVGTSDPILVAADCEAPVVAFAQPLCGGQLNLSADDQQPDLGLQHDVDVANGGVPSVELTVTRQDGSDELSATGDATLTSFSIVNFGDPGEVTLSATATDAAGNVGTANCAITVVVAPVVDILVPSASALLSTADDCGPAGGGYGITVSGTTSAAAGSSVEVSVGAGAPVALSPVASGGGGPNTFSGCVAIGDGVDQTLTVAVDDGVNPPGTDTVTLTVDTLAPADSVAAASISIVGRREGTVQFTWSHVEDTGGTVLAGYELRCAPTQILDESGWTAARSLTLATAPAAAGAPDAQETLGSFRVGTTEFCVIRGRDATDALTPLAGAAGNAAVSIDFLQTDYTAVLNANSAFTNVAALGDINGDGADDMIYGAGNLGLQVFFGDSTAHPFDTTADITISGVGSGLGGVMAGVGDVNGDSIPDFAVSARNLDTNGGDTGSGHGTVYLFYGRTTDDWPSSIDVTSGGCGASICLVGSVAGAILGADITGTNFDGSGPNDLVISARANNSLDGTVYVLLGGAQLNLAAGSTINVPGDNPNGFVIDAPANRSNFGASLAAVGDGGDGLGDLAIGANGVSPDVSALFFLRGETYPGGSSGLIVPSANPLLQVGFGSSTDYAVPVRPLGDFNGDGLGDLALGRDFSAGGGLGTGEVYLRNGAIFTQTTDFFFTFPATAGTENEYASYIAAGVHPALGTIGDLDGDGLTELVLGSLGPTAATPALDNGSIALFYGTATPAGRAREAADFTLASTAGIMVPNFVGDIDGDGFNDLAIVDGGSGTDKLILLH